MLKNPNGISPWLSDLKSRGILLVSLVGNGEIYQSNRIKSNDAKESFTEQSVYVAPTTNLCYI
jgi:hypothetical protein